MSNHNAASMHDPAGNASHNLMQYVYVALGLCVLSTASFITTSGWWTARFDHHVSWAFMMAISCCKALLVILFFMHVKSEANWKYVLTIPAAFMSIFLVLMLVPDVGMRNRQASEERRLFMANAPPSEPGEAQEGANSDTEE